MKDLLSLILVILTSITISLPGICIAETDRYKVVIEESYYTVAFEDKDQFIKIYRGKIIPFWREMKNRGIIQDDIRMYSQRIHPFEPHWTYKTVVRFTNYESIDKWLEIREDVINSLFPKAGGYKKVRGQISALTIRHWDEFIRELPLE